MYAITNNAPMNSVIITHQKATGCAALWRILPPRMVTRLSIKLAHAKQKRAIHKNGAPNESPFSFFAGKNKSPSPIMTKPKVLMTADFECVFIICL